MLPALAEQSEHGHITRSVPCQHRKQSRLADAGTREQTEPLTLTTGGKAVKRTHAEIDARPEPPAQRRVRGLGSDTEVSRARW